MERRRLYFGGRAAALMLVAAATASCSHFFDEEGDCAVSYRLRFNYSYNMKFADAFSHEVESVHLFAFDTSGYCQLDTVVSNAQLAANNYEVELPLDPGNYTLTAWCGANNNPGHEHFTIAHERAGRVEYSQHACCWLERKHEGDIVYQDEDLHPLYYGNIDAEMPAPALDGVTYYYDMPLIKDTNQVRVVLQHLSGADVDVNDFDFSITAQNGSLKHDNSIAPDEPIQYRAWGLFSGSAGVEVNDPGSRSRSLTTVSVARADLTIPRMTVEQRQSMMLNITRRTDGATVAQIPVIDYALLVKDLDSNGAAIHSDQEYLDRQDNYSMMFFLDERDNWVSSQIIINSWRIVLHSYDL